MNSDIKAHDSHVNLNIIYLMWTDVSTESRSAREVPMHVNDTDSTVCGDYMNHLFDAASASMRGSLR